MSDELNGQITIQYRGWTIFADDADEGGSGEGFILIKGDSGGHGGTVGWAATVAEAKASIDEAEGGGEPA